eukprot:scaffold164155_cov40-Tisochrysis_lutea.AAC.3
MGTIDGNNKRANANGGRSIEREVGRPMCPCALRWASREGRAGTGLVAATNCKVSCPGRRDEDCSTLCHAPWRKLMRSKGGTKKSTT